MTISDTKKEKVLTDIPFSEGLIISHTDENDSSGTAVESPADKEESK